MALEGNKYPKDKTIVDISHHNSDINFDIARQHVSMFIARTGDGHRVNTNGERQGVLDRKYKKFVADMKARGIPFGNYMFNRFSGVVSARQEAEDFWRVGDKDATVWVCDAEVSTAPNMKECIQVFINRLRELGAKKVGLYIGHHKYQEFGGASIDCDFTWIPRYGNKPAFACDLWQWTEYGNIPGVGKCDINVLYGNKGMDFFTKKDNSLNNGKVEINVGSVIQSGGVGWGSATEIAEALVNRGVAGRIEVQTDGIIYVVADKLSDIKLQELEHWMRSKGWAYSINGTWKDKNGNNL